MKLFRVRTITGHEGVYKRNECIVLDVDEEQACLGVNLAWARGVDILGQYVTEMAAGVPYNFRTETLTREDAIGAGEILDEKAREMYLPNFARCGRDA